jgi:hypothetical protein
LITLVLKINLFGAAGAVLFTAGLLDIGRYQFHVVVHKERYPSFRVVFLAKRNNVPIVVSGAVFLDARANLNMIHALFDGTVSGRLVAESIPMIQPAVALTNHLAVTINIFNLHRFLFLEMAPRRGQACIAPITTYYL